jgi:hypothetical protein
MIRRCPTALSCGALAIASVCLLGCSDDASRDDGAGAAGAASSGSGGASTGGSGSGNAGGHGDGGASSGGSAAGGAGGSGVGGGVPDFPADLIDLVPWKLTLPIAAADDDAPLEIEQPDLASYSIDPWFHLDSSKTAVVFRANAGGVTTSNSGYPRSELREMSADGSELAAWSTSSGKHTMTLSGRITHLPDAKPHVVVAQIHDADDDLVMVRLEGETLFVEGGGEDLGTLDPAYVLGTDYQVRIVAEAGEVKIFYQDLATPAVVVDRDAEGCYFKAGMYTQSNTETGDEPEAYGESEITSLAVEHP